MFTSNEFLLKFIFVLNKESYFHIFQNQFVNLTDRVRANLAAYNNNLRFDSYVRVHNYLYLVIFLNQCRHVLAVLVLGGNHFFYTSTIIKHIFESMCLIIFSTSFCIEGIYILFKVLF